MFKENTRRMSVTDRVGEVYGRLTVISRGPNHVEPSGATRATWVCKCECGGTITTVGKSLARGLTRSCGCLLREKPIKHGKSYDKIYRQWTAMKQRCGNVNHDHYADYGARGITICDKWRESFEAFYADMGNPPHSEMTLERIDNDKGYQPGNVRWATRLEQASNRRTNIEGNYTGVSVVGFNGKSLTLADWSKQTGISLENLRSRLNRDWSVERSLTTQVRKR